MGTSSNIERLKNFISEKTESGRKILPPNEHLFPIATNQFYKFWNFKIDLNDRFALGPPPPPETEFLKFIYFQIILFLLILRDLNPESSDA